MVNGKGQNTHHQVFPEELLQRLLKRLSELDLIFGTRCIPRNSISGEYTWISTDYESSTGGLKLFSISGGSASGSPSVQGISGTSGSSSAQGVSGTSGSP